MSRNSHNESKNKNRKKGTAKRYEKKKKYRGIRKHEQKQPQRK